MRAAARWFATRRRAAFTVATLLVVPSSSLASDSASSSKSTTVLDISSSMMVMSVDGTIVYQSELEERHHQRQLNRGPQGDLPGKANPAVLAPRSGEPSSIAVRFSPRVASRLIPPENGDFVGAAARAVAACAMVSLFSCVSAGRRADASNFW